MNPLKLYVDHLWTSPWAMAVFIALREKNLSFSTQVLDLAKGEQNAEPYASLSITQRVPTLVDGDFAVGDSMAILAYLEQQYPQISVYPSQMQQRIRALHIQNWLRTDLMPLRQERDAEIVFLGARREPELSASGQVSVDKLIGVCEQLLPVGAAHLFGEWSIVDSDLAMTLMRLVAHEDPIPERLKVYALNQWQRPSVQAWAARESGFTAL